MTTSAVPATRKTGTQAQMRPSQALSESMRRASATSGGVEADMRSPLWERGGGRPILGLAARPGQRRLDFCRADEAGAAAATYATRVMVRPAPLNDRKTITRSSSHETS